MFPILLPHSIKLFCDKLDMSYIVHRYDPHWEHSDNRNSNNKELLLDG